MASVALDSNSNFGRRLVWVVKWCLIWLKFCQLLGDSWIYRFAKFRVIWICGLLGMN